MANYQTLQNVNNFESLIEYLRDELDWDFQAEDIEDLTFDYEPEELGLDEATAAKIDGIKQLRPLTNSQTWGIFYIDFEPKKLPIVALRRILSKLVIKRRTSANQSDRAAWQMNDLLFLSSYGENRTRTISFAHFADNTGFGDLPTLKTITWNNLDTALHLKHADETLKTKLRFPDDPNDAKAWREQWASAFTQRHGEVVRTSQQLARRLAELASDIREKANAILHLENEKGELRKLHRAFQEALIHDLSYDDFADMYAQTISYGLLTAKISRPEGLVADNIADMIPVTNPFLKELLQTFLVVGGRGNLIDFDELGINNVVEMLRKADMEAVLRDFGDKNPNEDPAIHFYELFLKEYDPEKRMKRGVFYTPRPVVSFIVRSVHEILQKEFGLADGLADTTTWAEFVQSYGFSREKPSAKRDGFTPKGVTLNIPEGVKPDAPFVQILDPATGTGTFLVEVINVIYETLQQKWAKEGKSKNEQIEEWNDYVPKNLLPRLFGFELMMAPYSIAHMKIGLKLSETGYRFLSSERAQIYLTNTLEEPKDFSDYFAVMSPALAHEASAANKVKRETPITVVVGNPPYSRDSSNRTEYAETFVKGYKEDVSNERNIQPLSDDYVKFLGFSEFTINKINIGLVGMITNHSFLHGIIHRGVRHCLTNFYNKINVIDLHGNSNIQEISPFETQDENVFEIKQGVSISILGRTFKEKNSNVKVSDFWGSRADKYEKLLKSKLADIDWQDVIIRPNEYFFSNPKDISIEKEYKSFISLLKCFPTFATGFITHRDEFVIDEDRETLLERVNDFADDSNDDDFIASKYNLRSNRDWKIPNARLAIQALNNPQENIMQCTYRPFDDKWCWWGRELMDFPRPELKQFFVGKNITLLCKRQNKKVPFSYAFVTDKITESCTFESAHANNVAFPLFVYPTEKEKAFGATERVPNFSDEFIEEFSNKLGLEFVYDGETGADAGQDVDTFTPEDVFHYAYAVFHSPTYRARYAEFLKIDFPRLPLTTDSQLFRQLCAHGKQLVNLHLLESVNAPADWKLHQDGAALFQNKTVAAGFPKKELADTDENGTGKVYINKTTYFDDVPETVFNFHIGGYQVCHKWLKDRKDRELLEEDINHYGKITVALSETIRLMAEIDEAIEEHGGFPLVGSQN